MHNLAHNTEGGGEGGKSTMGTRNFNLRSTSNEGHEWDACFEGVP